MRISLKAALVAATAVTALPAYADDDIVVTATRSPSPVERLPADVEIIDTDAARERGDVTLEAALAEVPGMQAPRSGPPGQQTSIFSGGFESNHTLVLFDGVRLDDVSTPEGVFDAGQDLLGDASRIEVVQGPMSALYGSGALGGVVNLLPRRGGPGVFNPRLEVAGGSFGTLISTAGADGTLGRLRYALTADAFVTNGFDVVPKRIATYTGEADGAEMNTLTGVFDYALGDTLSLDLLLRRREARADYDPGFFGNIDENPEAEVRQNDSSLWRIGATWNASGAFSARLSGGEFETDRALADAGIAGDEYHGSRRFADVSATWRRDAWTFQLGAQAEDESIDAVSYGSAIVGDQKHWGAFAAAQGVIIGSTDITAAVRHDDFEGFGAATTWRAGASHRFTDAARVYAAYGTSYRAPSLYERFVPFFGAAGLDPEEARSWEIGAEGRFGLFGVENGLELGALYRSSEIDDLIGFFGFSYANVDRAEIDFAEARARVRPLDWLSGEIVYANTDARNTDTDQALQRRPRHAWSAALRAEHGPFSGELAWRQVGSRLDTVYDDAGLWSGVSRVEAYDIVRASAAWSVNDAVRLYIAGDNVLDETYEPVNGFAGAPASILVGLRITP